MASVGGPHAFPLIVEFVSSSHQLKKYVVKVGPPLTKLSGSAHDIDISQKGDSSDKQISLIVGICYMHCFV